MAGVTSKDEAQAAVESRSDTIGRGGILSQAARAPDSYALLLLLLIIDYVILSVGWTGSWALIVTTGFLGLTAVLAFHTSRVGGAPFKVVVAGTGLAMIASIAAAIDNQELIRGIPFILMSLVVVGCPVAILTRLVRHACHGRDAARSHLRLHLHRAVLLLRRPRLSARRRHVLLRPTWPPRAVGLHLFQLHHHDHCRLRGSFARQRTPQDDLSARGPHGADISRGARFAARGHVQAPLWGVRRAMLRARLEGSASAPGDDQSDVYDPDAGQDD